MNKKYCIWAGVSLPNPELADNLREGGVKIIYLMGKMEKNGESLHTRVEKGEVSESLAKDILDLSFLFKNAPIYGATAELKPLLKAEAEKFKEFGDIYEIH